MYTFIKCYWPKSVRCNCKNYRHCNLIIFYYYPGASESHKIKHAVWLTNSVDSRLPQDIIWCIECRDWIWLVESNFSEKSEAVFLPWTLCLFCFEYYSKMLFSIKWKFSTVASLNLMSFKQKFLSVFPVFQKSIISSLLEIPLVST